MTNCGPTHYTGCPCHEARRDRLLEAAERVVRVACVLDAGYWHDEDFFANGGMNRAMNDLSLAIADFDAIKKETERD